MQVALLPLKPYRQRPGFCGPASLKIVLEYYGVSKSEDALAQLAGATQKHGVDATGIIRAAHSLGFVASITDNATLEDIAGYLERKIPLIVDWFSQDDGHYSVVAGMDETNIYLEDPELGHQRALTRAAFQTVWFDFPGEFIGTKDDLILRRIIIVRPPSGDE